jgi:hypothetical protein
LCSSSSCLRHLADNKTANTTTSAEPSTTIGVDDKHEHDGNLNNNLDLDGDLDIANVKANNSTSAKQDLDGGPDTTDSETDDNVTAEAGVDATNRAGTDTADTGAVDIDATAGFDISTRGLRRLAASQ